LNTPQSTIDKVIELTKLNNTIPNIEKELQLTYKEVIKILIDNNLKTMIGLKSSITKDLKIIETSKTIDERTQLVDEINISINKMYENFKWVSDNICSNCKEYFNEEDLGKQITDFTTIDTEHILNGVKRNDSLVSVLIGSGLTPNEIIQLLIHHNKIKKSTITKRLNKIQSETTKDKRKLLRLDIEEVIDEMYHIYKWFVFDYENCVEANKMNIELDEEENFQ